ncbi:MAG: small acid-soluble spore protein alpha/beta type [Aristaeellaceae bacterium]
MADWRLEDNKKRKYEAARRFGLTDKLAQVGWAGLSAKEAGRIGGSLHGRRKHAAH